jgi:predicted glutamine amidotransferase
MCVIVIKPNNVKISHDTIRDCWYANPDGAGICYIAGGLVQIEKGFMDTERLINRIDKLQSKTLIIHFRWATHGLHDAGNCHPFPISFLHEDLRRKKVSTTCAIFHNGVINTVKSDKILSDSQVFVRDVLTFLSDEDLKENIDVEASMAGTGSKFAMMFKDGTVKTVGAFYTKNGLRFSNLNWDYKRKVYYGAKSYAGVTKNQSYYEDIFCD